MKKKLVTAIAAALIFSMVPAIPAAAEEVAATASTDSENTVTTDEASEVSQDTAETAQETGDNTEQDTKEETAKEQKKTTPKKKDKPKKQVKPKKQAKPKKKKKKVKAKPQKKAYVPVNAKNLTSSYKTELSKKRKSVVNARYTKYDKRSKFEEDSLIGLTWNELQKLSQVGITRGDFDFMCRVVSAEAGDSASYQAKEMTAECIVNRARAYSGVKCITRSLKAKGQFSVVRNGACNRITINGETVNACKDALIKNSHPKTLLYFSAGRYFSWAKPYMRLDGTYFCLKK